jgi:hypothetical protein
LEEEEDQRRKKAEEEEAREGLSQMIRFLINFYQVQSFENSAHSKTCLAHSLSRNS